ncbi:unnamed protein product [Symbiodinium natans]|uniref:Uncharacterized protein n=1 Tax=Symbiodinium natans TaxID=878477 RepID=A0A812Q194_9DINO|nr:unnamed protein product [Symbiodinium natans]
MLRQGDYMSMVESQKPEQQLSQTTFQAIQELRLPREALGGSQMSRAQLAALLVLLALRVLDGLGAFGVFRSGDEIKSSRVKVLTYAIANLDAYLPSITSLDAEVYHQMTAMVRMLYDFNFAQLLQGENNPHSVWQLQCGKEEEGEDDIPFRSSEYPVRGPLPISTSFAPCLLGFAWHATGYHYHANLVKVTGSISLAGSLFLTELNGRSVLKGLSCLQDLSETQSQVSFAVFAMSWLPIRLGLCSQLSRTVQASSLQALVNDWEALTDQEQDALLELFLTDGHDDKAFIILYLPLFLANAMANPQLGLRCGLQFLVELYSKLLAHRCLNQDGSTVKVDISSLAASAKTIDNARLLRQCLDCSRIVKHGNGVTVLLTAESYQFMSGQLVEEDRRLNLLELVAAQQRRLEDALVGNRKQNLVRCVQPRPEKVLSDAF